MINDISIFENEYRYTKASEKTFQDLGIIAYKIEQPHQNL